jgi:hypothetical protein
MPIYRYAVVRPDGSRGEPFEILQGIQEPPLAQHPETGEPVERLLTAPARPMRTRMGDGTVKDKDLGRLGFTKYEKTGDGRYEKTAGKGPDRIIG